MPATHLAPLGATPYHLGRSGLYSHPSSAAMGRRGACTPTASSLPPTPGDATAMRWPCPARCRVGRPDPWSIPPTEAQLNAIVARDRCDRPQLRAWGQRYHHREGDDPREAAANRERCRSMHGTTTAGDLGGSGERWDFLPTQQKRPAQRWRVHLSNAFGGFLLKPSLNLSRSPSVAPPAIRARSQELAVEIDAKMAAPGPWRRAAGSLRDPYDWEPNRAAFLIGSLDVAPTFRKNQVQPSVGWPLFGETSSHPATRGCDLARHPSAKTAPGAVARIARRIGDQGTSFETLHPDRTSWG